ncbi:MAG TPA: D-2-hydroxyacid dehydrogenase [Xanthobacteraceae bacterium]|jgi:phosphoglycerate dehydrogenase-like enzyme|nr:D-2-hydroxyacid dehydrogenase [Xanthobacteraceae bacterium]
MSTNVLILETYADVYAGYLREAFPDLELHPIKRLSDLRADLADMDVLVAFGIAIDDDMIRRATRLKWIQSLATGVDHFLRCPSLRPEVYLTSARGIHGPAMRETVAYLMLSLSHDTRRLVEQQRQHRWDRSRPWSLLCGKTAVIVGVGLSGTAIARLLKAFGMRVVGVSRTPREVEGFDRIVTPDRLPEVASEADYLINILPGDKHNLDLIGAKLFAAMKPTAFFVNVGRGETVDEQALIAALKEGRIAGAGLDVFRTEPLPAASPLWNMPNVFLTSHIGGLFSEYEEYVMPILGDNMRLFLDGHPEKMRNLVPH